MQNLPAFHLIWFNLSSDLTLTTLIYEISPFQLAVATLLLGLLRSVTHYLRRLAHKSPLREMPRLYPRSQISRPTTQILTLHPCPPPNQLLRRRSGGGGGASAPIVAAVDTSSLSLYYPTQTVILQHLLETRPPLPLHAQDIHRNTPLQYLAGPRVIKTDLLDLLRSREPSEDHNVSTKIWAESRNRWGFTPQELFEDGEGIRVSML